jgi:hypothetical protein
MNISKLRIVRKIYLKTRELNYLSLKCEKIYFMLYVKNFILLIIKFIYPEIYNVIHSKILMNI